MPSSKTWLSPDIHEDARTICDVMTPTERLIIAFAVVAVLAAHAHAQARGVVVSGAVFDETGGALAGAAVQLVTSDGSVPRSTTADQSGTFRFDGVLPGNYKLQINYEGFKPRSTGIRVGTRPPAVQQITLELNNIEQQLTVSDGTTEVGTNTNGNLDAVSVDARDLESLPIFDQDLVGTLSRFLDPGAIGAGGPTIVVNGMEVSALRVSASAIQQIKINQDPYSSEFMRPGRGRIDIITKPGGQEYSGAVNLRFRDSAFFGQPVSAAPARRIQFSMRLRY